MDNSTNETGIDGESTGFFSNVLNFFTSILQLLNPVTFFQGLINVILNGFSYFNPLSENFIFTHLFDWLNPFSENFILTTLFTWTSGFFTSLGNTFQPLWSFITNLLSWLNPLSENFFAYKLLQLLGNLLQTLFVPSQARINALLNVPRSKFTFIDTISTAINSMKDIINNIGNAPRLTLDLSATRYTSAGNYTILDLSWYAPYKNYGDLILTGFIYIAFLWRLFIRIPAIINGQSGAIIGDYELSDKNYYTNSKHGFGKHF